MTRRISTGLSTTDHVFLRSVVKVFQQQAPRSLSKFLKSFIPNPEVVHPSLSKFKRSSQDERRPSRFYAVSTWAILQSLSEFFEVVFHSLEIKSFCPGIIIALWRQEGSTARYMDPETYQGTKLCAANARSAPRMYDQEWPKLKLMDHWQPRCSLKITQSIKY